MKPYSKATKAKIAKYTSLGFSIIEGNNSRLDKTKKYSKSDVVLLCKTNANRYNCGRSYTVWAVK